MRTLPNVSHTSSTYNPAEIEAKWLELWESWELFQNTEQGSGQSDGHSSNRVSNQANNTVNSQVKEKLYLLFAFAYPSGSGLHVGHVESKTALDILARYNRMQGKDVFFPVGWDAFGLPAENYAIKTGVPPVETTKNAIDTFRRQIKRVGISYDWANEIATCHPGYYKWTQWLFLELFSQGLAYKKTGLVNWCPSCQTVLANEQVVDGVCERCDTQVIQKEMDQWFFKITQYQDELISGLDEVDWPHPTKQQQLHWIGRSDGALIEFKISNSQEVLSVYTTAHDTIYGATFMVLAPEHTLLYTLKDSISNWAEVEKYINTSQKKTELQRQVNKEKTGIKLEGVFAVNPMNQSEIPMYVADYVLANYGTGAIMAVPGHDERDFEFAKKFNIPIIYTARARGDDSDESFISYSDIKANPTKYECINSEEFSGLDYTEARKAILDNISKSGFGQAKVQYRLRDWLISRQRYWGAPIPIVYDPDGNPHPVHQEALPWELPTDVDYNPKGVSPLASSKEFVVRTQEYAVKYHADLIAEKGWDATGKGWQPEFDTMDTFVDSSWYFLRYLDARNTSVFAKKSQLDKWLPVDFYMIGPEHIVLHLLYSRFFTKFLRDQGHLTINEPFAKMRHQGMILGPDHRKMSKSKGNVINPDDIIDKFGADTLRVYEMFMGPIESDKPWDTRAVVGVYKFLQRVYDLVMLSSKLSADITQKTSKQSSSQMNTRSNAQTSSQIDIQMNTDVRRKMHQTVHKISTDIPQLKFNTAIAAMMECLNFWEKEQRKSNTLIVSKEDVTLFVLSLAPFAPFLAEELYYQLLNETQNNAPQQAKPPSMNNSVHLAQWMSPSEELLTVDQIRLPVQVNGKVRAQLEIAAHSVQDTESVITQAKALDQVKPWLEKGTITKELYVPGRIVTFAVS